MTAQKQPEKTTPCAGVEGRAGYDLRRFLWRATHNTDGVAAIEFGMIAMPLFIFIFGIIEIGLCFAAGLVLEGSAAEAGRAIRTGQVQQAAEPETAFREALCSHANTMLDCARIQYEVIRIGDDSFQTAESSEPQFDDDGNLIEQDFNAGNSNDVILIRTAYRYEFITPFIGAMMTGDPGRNWMTHMSTIVIKAEPYVFGED